MNDLETRVREQFADAQRLLASGDLAAACAAFEALLPLLAQAGDRLGQGRVLFQIGSIHEQQGETEPARAGYEKALAALGNEDAALKGAVLHRLGHLLRSNDPAAARERFHQSAVLCDTAGDRRGAALSRAMVGQIDFTSGRREAGLATMLAALASLPAHVPERSHLLDHVVYFALRLPPERFAELVHENIGDASLAEDLHRLMHERRASS